MYATTDIITMHPDIFIALQERALQEQKIFVSAFDDPYIIAGQVGQAQTLHGCMQGMHSASSTCCRMVELNLSAASNQWR